MLFTLAHQDAPDVGMSTNATCDKSYSWMYNSRRESPCLVAAKVVGACHAGNWKVGSLRAGGYYAPPTNVTANVCSCSYSAYNLLSACTTCQQGKRSVLSWAVYIQHCAEHQRSKVYFPENIPWNISIPYWASKDPGLLDGHQFNTSNALYFASQNIPDLVPGTTDWQIPDTGPAKVSWTATAVVGGLLGGLVGVMLLIDIALYLFYRRARRYSLKRRSYIAQQKLKAIADAFLSEERMPGSLTKPRRSMLTFPDSVMVKARDTKSLSTSSSQEQ